MKPSGIEPATFRFVAQYLNHCATAVPTYIANTHNKRQEPTEINVLQLNILINILKIFNIQNDEIHIVLHIVTAL
jgi:hypothetical protein